MLMVGSFAKGYVDACRTNIVAQLAGYRKVLAAKQIEVGRTPVLQPMILRSTATSFTAAVAGRMAIQNSTRSRALQ